MARNSDTAERTMDAAWAMLAEGQYPSAQTVRERTGQGSMTTINSVLKDQFWPAVTKRVCQPPLPPPMADLMRTLWDRALECAELGLDQRRAELEARLAEAEAGRERLAAELEAARAELASIREEAALAGERLAASHEVLDAARVELEGVSEVVTAAAQDHDDDDGPADGPADDPADGPGPSDPQGFAAAAAEWARERQVLEGRLLQANIDREAAEREAESLAAQVDSLAERLANRPGGAAGGQKNPGKSGQNARAANGPGQKKSRGNPHPNTPKSDAKNTRKGGGNAGNGASGGGKSAQPRGGRQNAETAQGAGAVARPQGRRRRR